jgi:hypothetical protein
MHDTSTLPRPEVYQFSLPSQVLEIPSRLGTLWTAALALHGPAWGASDAAWWFWQRLLGLLGSGAYQDALVYQIGSARKPGQWLLWVLTPRQVVTTGPVAVEWPGPALAWATRWLEAAVKGEAWPAL